MSENSEHTHARSQLLFNMYNIIRILHEREMQTEKSVPLVTNCLASQDSKCFAFFFLQFG